ncbi:SPFH domain-containing protein [Streptomyces subrutilus]|uniref:SPFH domain-containing protein n=1 Tax=Streptomyces subrutilus TaxID=36818 RepID=UPI0033C5568D
MTEDTMYPTRTTSATGTFRVPAVAAPALAAAAASPEPVRGAASQPAPNQAVGQAPNQAVGQAPHQAPGQAPNPAPGQAPQPAPPPLSGETSTGWATVPAVLLAAGPEVPAARARADEPAPVHPGLDIPHPQAEAPQAGPATLRLRVPDTGAGAAAPPPPQPELRPGPEPAARRHAPDPEPMPRPAAVPAPASPQPDPAAGHGPAPRAAQATAPRPGFAPAVPMAEARPDRDLQAVHAFAPAAARSAAPAEPMAEARPEPTPRAAQTAPPRPAFAPAPVAARSAAPAEPTAEARPEPDPRAVHAFAPAVGAGARPDPRPAHAFAPAPVPAPAEPRARVESEPEPDPRPAPVVTAGPGPDPRSAPATVPAPASAEHQDTARPESDPRPATASVPAPLEPEAENQPAPQPESGAVRPGVPGPGVAEIVAQAVARGLEEGDEAQEGPVPHGPPLRGAAVTEVPVHLPFLGAQKKSLPAPAPARASRPAPAPRPAPGRRAPRVDERLREHRGPVLPGWIGVGIGGLALAGCAAVLWRAGAVPDTVVAAFGGAPRAYRGLHATHWPPLAFLGIVALLALGGLGRSRAGHAWVLTLFGRYRGTVRRTGLTWISPLLLRRRVDVRLRHWRSDSMPAVDSGGLALQVVVQVVWQVRDTARAALAVEDHVEYLAEQVESAMARVLSRLPADAFHEDAPTLRDTEAVGDALTRMLAAETEAVGIEVFSAQPTRIEYAPEVAEAMRRRRVAAIDAKHRDAVLSSVVDAVDDTVHRLTSRGLVELDDYERKALVKDLTVAFYTGRGE